MLSRQGFHSAMVFFFVISAGARTPVEEIRFGENAGAQLRTRHNSMCRIKAKPKLKTLHE